MSEKEEENVVCKTYKDFLKAGKDVVEAVKLPFKVKTAKNDLAGEIIKLEGEIAECELAIIKAKGNHPFAMSKILNEIDSKELKERQLKQANELMEELFPE